MKICLTICLIFVMCAEANTAESNTNQEPYQFGVFPFLPPEKLEKLWSPITAELSGQSSRKIKLRTRSSYSIFRNDVSSEIFDIVYIQPFAYVRTGSKHNYVPLVRFVMKGDSENSGLLDSVIVIRKDGEIKSLHDLKGKSIAAPPKTAAVSLLGRAHLLSAVGFKSERDYQIHYHLNHISCLRQLVIKKVSACMTAHPPYTHFLESSKANLKVLSRSERIPSSMIAVHERVKPEDREIIKKYFLNLKHNRAGREFIRKGGYSGFIETHDKDYDSVRKIWNEIGTR